jgi:hypothetical protein
MRGAAAGQQRVMSEAPEACMGHVRVGGGVGWVTAGSTRKATASSLVSLLVSVLAGTEEHPGHP